MEEKKAVLAEIIYKNRENGYTVGVAENEEEQEQFTVVGYMPGAEQGQTFLFQGEWKVHASYGRQFQVSGYRQQMPETPEGIEHFLASGVLKGIGKKTAKAIVQKFGSDTLRILEEEPERLTEVGGIGRVKALSVADAYQAHKEFAEIVVYFQQYGISAAYAMRLYKVYGGDTIAAVESNPYQLVDDIFGIGFRKADEIASKLGIDPHSEYRLHSGILYGLWNYVNEGHVFVPRKLLCETIGELLHVGAEEIYEELTQLAFEGNVHIELLENREVVYLAPYYTAEQNVCRKLIELNQAQLKTLASGVDGLIAAAERDAAISLSERQKEAVRTAVNSGVCVITGGPGTGKTTIIHTIIRVFQQSGLKTAIAAPTGRAAKRITETSGFYASTIHRLLEYYYSEDDSQMSFGKNREDPLDYDAVIIDEASMIDILLMNGLLAALRPGTRLIVVGDADQLPSVGAGNVLRDMIAGEVIPCVELKEIFRQAQESMIVVNAHCINRGEYPGLNEKDKDFFFLRRKGEKEMLETLKDLCIRRLPSYFESCDPLRDVQILTPVRKGTLGTLNLNRELQEILNPPSPDKKEKKFGDRIFREGDKVMQMKNNYTIEWKRMEDFTEGSGVFNGDSGFIDSIDTEFNELVVVYEDSKYVKYEFGQLDELELAYAITVHKSQGSEFPLVIMPVSWFPPMLATRNLLYTAVTRAKQAVVLVGSEDKMRAMVDNNRTEERWSGLSPKLRSFLELS